MALNLLSSGAQELRWLLRENRSLLLPSGLLLQWSREGTVTTLLGREWYTTFFQIV